MTLSHGEILKELYYIKEAQQKGVLRLSIITDLIDKIEAKP